MRHVLRNLKFFAHARPPRLAQDDTGGKNQWRTGNPACPPPASFYSSAPPEGWPPPFVDPLPPSFPPVTAEPTEAAVSLTCSTTRLITLRARLATEGVALAAATTPAAAATAATRRTVFFRAADFFAALVFALPRLAPLREADALAAPLLAPPREAAPPFDAPPFFEPPEALLLPPLDDPPLFFEDAEALELPPFFEDAPPLEDETFLEEEPFDEDTLELPPFFEDAPLEDETFLEEELLEAEPFDEDDFPADFDDDTDFFEDLAADLLLPFADDEPALFLALFAPPLLAPFDALFFAAMMFLLFKKCRMGSRTFLMQRNVAACMQPGLRVARFTM
jgi:hypothetical protein